MTVDEIRAAIAQEFGPHADRFRFVDLELSAALAPTPPLVGRGVYVFWTKKGVVRVGKSSSRDVCLRAVEHIRDNTGGLMGALRDDPTAKILFFVTEARNDHWIVALETYLDMMLKPQVPAKRRP